jgi:hypothetical protein
MNKLYILTFLLIIASSCGSLHCTHRRLDDDLMPFATYCWENEAKDVSQSPARHDGILHDQVTAKDGTPEVQFDYGIDLGVVPELDGASTVLFSFEDITFSNLPDHNHCSVLLGGGYHKCWVGWRSRNDAMFLVFNVGGWGQDGFYFDYRVKVGDGVVSEFDSIEYRFEGTKKNTDHRLAMRHDGGSWVEGGWESHEDFFRTFPMS